MLAQADGLSALYSLHGPVLHLVAVVAGHGLQCHGRAENLFGLAGCDDFGQSTFMIQFHVVADNVVNLLGLEHMSHAAEQGFVHACRHCINQAVLFVFDEVGVVGCAFRTAGIAVKIVVIVVDDADPVGILCNFECVHKDFWAPFPEIGNVSLCRGNTWR